MLPFNIVPMVYVNDGLDLNLSKALLRFDKVPDSSSDPSK